MDEITVSRLTIDIGASSDDARRQISRVTDALSRLRGNTSQRVKVDTKDVDKAHKKVGALANILNSIKRIAFYRVIRSAIKAVGEAFSEGAENAYWYSKTMGDSTKYIADAYDRLASGGFKMQNQLGAAWATLKSTITPILLEIVRLVTLAAQALTQFFAVLGGKGSYLKAIDYSKEWAETTARGAGAAKEWKNQLMGFDEINRLEEPSTGGGGGGAALPDYENMFEEADVDERLKRIGEKLKNFASKLNINFKDVFFSWDDLNAEQIAMKVIVGLGALAGGIAGFSIGGVPGMIIGTLTGMSIGLIVDTIAFNNNGKIDEKEFISMLVMAMGGIGGAIIGASIGGVAGAAIGFVIGVSISLVLQKMNWLNPVKGQSAEVVQEYLNEVKERFDNAEPGTYEASYFDRWKRYAERQMEEAGKASADGFGNGVEGEFTVLGWLKSVWERILENVRTSFGIHSPSTVFKGYGNNIVQGLWDGIQEKWDSFTGWFESKWGSFKSWWGGLSLGAFDFKTPHIRVDWEAIPNNSILARFLGFTSIPHIGIDWYAKGGIVDGATLIGAGEAGKEAIIPLERNTEWISKVAAEMNAQQARQSSPNGDIGAALEDANDGVINAIFAVGAQVVQAIAENSGGGEIDWRQVSQQVTKYQRQFARANG